MNISVVHAAEIENPLLQGSYGFRWLELFLQAISTAIIPFLILAFLIGGFMLISARGGSGINDAKSFLFKLIIAASVILGLGMLSKIALSTISALYNSF